jgi:hypothetical protein
VVSAEGVANLGRSMSFSRGVLAPAPGPLRAKPADATGYPLGIVWSAAEPTTRDHLHSLPT